MVKDGEQLRNIVKWRRRSPTRVVKLGNVLNELIENRVSPLQAKFELITEVWSQLLPAELRQHCKIASVSGGQLKVLVDSSSFANELRWCGPSLLEEIKRRCPQARIKNIQFIIG